MNNRAYNLADYFCGSLIFILLLIAVYVESSTLTSAKILPEGVVISSVSDPR